MKKILGACFFCLIVLGCSNVVTNHYATRKQAEEDRLFERGWLPDFIPQSSYDITTRNDLDLNLSEGEFSCSPDELEQFTKRLTPRKGELNAFEYSNNGYRWIFLVEFSKGHVEYGLGPIRGQPDAAANGPGAGAPEP